MDSCRAGADDADLSGSLRVGHDQQSTSGGLAYCERAQPPMEWSASSNVPARGWQNTAGA